MDYRQTLEFLESRGNEVQGIHLGLHRTRAMLEALGNPHSKFQGIHITGTNGKGSVAAMAESLLRHSGRHTGLYTSPHLVRVEERIQIDGRQISPRTFANLASSIRDREAKMLAGGGLDRALTFFEFLTCCAFLCFAEKAVDSAVIEVGLGGKLDATNLFQPQVSVITGVSYDHQNLLGHTLSEIALEKAGIIKRGTPIISGCRAGTPREVIRQVARREGAPLLELDRDFTISRAEERRGFFSMDLHSPKGPYSRLRLSLRGEHQTRNAALAVIATEALLSSLSIPAVREGLATTAWPGRLDEYAAERTTLLEGAHNPEGARTLSGYLKAHPTRDLHLVFGALSDKDIRKMGSCLFPLADTIHLAPLSNLRSASPEMIAEMHRKYGSRMRLHENSRQALKDAWAHCSSQGLVVVTGSLYLIGEVLPLVQRSAAERVRVRSSRFAVRSSQRAVPTGRRPN